MLQTAERCSLYCLFSISFRFRTDTNASICWGFMKICYMHQSQVAMCSSTVALLQVTCLVASVSFLISNFSSDYFKKKVYMFWWLFLYWIPELQIANLPAIFVALPYQALLHCHWSTSLCLIPSRISYVILISLYLPEPELICCMLNLFVWEITLKFYI